MPSKLHVVEGGVTNSYKGKVVACEELLPFLVVGVGGILWSQVSSATVSLNDTVHSIGKFCCRCCCYCCCKVSCY